MNGRTSTRRVSITVAPNGGRRTKRDHPALPMTAAEIARDAAACAAAGAAMVHVHARDGDGRHLLDAEACRDIAARIRAEAGDGLVIQATSESLGLYSPRKQMAFVRALRPEAVSLALRELAPGPDEEREFADFLGWIAREGIFPQIILYDAGEARRLAGMAARGMLPWQTVPVLFVLGRYSSGQQSSPDELLAFVAPGMERFAHWSLCAFGTAEAACVVAAALLGGHVRVGFENNLHRPDGSPAASNADLVRPVTAALGALALAPQTADGLRAELTALLQ